MCCTFNIKNTSVRSISNVRIWPVNSSEHRQHDVSTVVMIKHVHICLEGFSPAELTSGQLTDTFQLHVWRKHWERRSCSFLPGQSWCLCASDLRTLSHPHTSECKHIRMTSEPVQPVVQTQPIRRVYISLFVSLTCLSAGCDCVVSDSFVILMKTVRTKVFLFSQWVVSIEMVSQLSSKASTLITGVVTLPVHQVVLTDMYSGWLIENWSETVENLCTTMEVIQ